VITWGKPEGGTSLHFGEVADGLLAYIDPGVGSSVFQIAVATLLGGLYALKVYWKDIKKRLFGRGDDPGDDQLS